MSNKMKQSKVTPISSAQKLREEQELARQIDQNIRIGAIGSLLAMAMTSYQAINTGTAQFAVIGNFDYERQKGIYADMIGQARDLAEDFKVNPADFALKFDNGAYVRVVSAPSDEDLRKIDMAQFAGVVILDR